MIQVGLALFPMPKNANSLRWILPPVAIGAGAFLLTAIWTLQGRYFIPIALLFFLPFLRQKRGDETLATVAVVGLSLVANMAVLKAIVDAFYI